MNYPEYKKKVHEEFDEKFPFHDSCDLPDEGECDCGLKSFLDTTLDNLLVEVEGIVDAVFVSKPDREEELAAYDFKKHVVDETKAIIKEHLTRFKGEEV
jgi:hypothetical protein